MSVKCGLSDIFIKDGDFCGVSILSKGVPSDHDRYRLVTLPIFGCVDEFGRMEDIVKDDNYYAIEDHYKMKMDEIIDKYLFELFYYDADVYNFLKQPLYTNESYLLNYKNLDNKEYKLPIIFNYDSEFLDLPKVTNLPKDYYLNFSQYESRIDEIYNIISNVSSYKLNIFKPLDVYSIPTRKNSYQIHKSILKNFIKILDTKSDQKDEF